MQPADMETVVTPQTTPPTGGKKETSSLEINKEQFLADLGALHGLLRTYGELLDSISDSESWSQNALKILHEQKEKITPAANPLKQYHVVLALFAYMMSKTSQQRFRFHIPTRVGSIPEIENQGLSDYSYHQREIRPSFEGMAQDISDLLDLSTCKDPERIESLTTTIVSFFKALVRQDWEDLTLVMTHLNLVTTSKESHSLIEQIAKIAREIYNSLNQFSEYFTVESLSHSTEELPDAVEKLKSVISRLEDAANTNLDSLDKLSGEARDSLARITKSEEVLANCLHKLEELSTEQPQMAEGLDEVGQLVREKIQPELQSLRDRHQEYSQIYLELVSNQSFQDLTGQVLKKVISFIETLQFKLVELLPNYRQVSAQVAALGEGNMPATSAAQSQDQVDQLLAELGF